MIEEGKFVDKSYFIEEMLEERGPNRPLINQIIITPKKRRWSKNPQDHMAESH